jgi:tRNA nucleotidyltransferase (CCA-adding enzyme)
MIDCNIRALEAGEAFSDFDRYVIGIIKRGCSSFPGKNITARIAGGWVRDHILGIKSDDIDIIIDSVSCNQFGEKILPFDGNFSIAHLSYNNAEGKALPIVRIGISKDTWFDITDYGEEGSPIEDARRRDFTINALFFNITTMKVEDYFGGIDDMKNNILRTPIDPKQSCLEDPRRVLRCFRFAAMFNYTVDPALIEAIKNTRDSFDKNISKGRIGRELQKMLDSENIIRAMDLIVETEMFDSIFDPNRLYNLNSEEAVNRVRKLAPVLGLKNRLTLVLSAIYYQMYKPDSNATTLNAALKKLYISNNIGYEAKKYQKAAYAISHKMNLNRVDVGRLIMDLGETWEVVKYMLMNDDELSFYENEFAPFVEREKLRDIWKLEPLMKGPELAEATGTKLGKETRRLIDKMVDWQINNPNKTKEDYKEFLSKQKNI